MFRILQKSTLQFVHTHYKNKFIHNDKCKVPAADHRISFTNDT